VGLIGSNATSHALELKVEVLSQSDLVLQTNFAALNKATIELAHEYDESNT
jgi:hypothetical protein